MLEATKTPRGHLRWKFHHLLLMLVPGTIFLATYPGNYKTVLERAERALRVDPSGNFPTVYCEFVAGIMSGFLMVIGMLLCAAFLSLKQPTRRQTLIRFLFALGIMTTVNFVICIGGCALGSHQTTELQDTVRKLHRPIAPQGTGSGPDAVQSQ